MTTNANEPEPIITTSPTSKTIPGLAVAPPDLERTIEIRRTEIVARLGELTSDVRLEAADERDKLKAKLSELAHLVKENVVDGWANIAAAGKIKLGHWLGQ
ncbi:MAG TPA: hypothetical protein VGO00_23975 [Kofleriaceae bacterium]|jgi:hypothetical protein|nr:hypothetical protein [Kofleriaceae bacterium]